MIGFFDSGVGGLSVWSAFQEEAPTLPLLYFADQEYCPYGEKSHDELIDRADKITAFLIAKGAKIIVVACNTATAAAIEFLRNKYTIPFVGMEPAIKTAALASSTKAVGVLATEGTFSGRLFNETKEKYAKGVNVIIQAGKGMVDLVENQLIGTPTSHKVLAGLLVEMITHNVDHIVLGCTHYPFLKNDIQEIVGSEVKLIDPAPAVVRQIKRIIKKENLVFDNNGKYQFYTSNPNVSMFQEQVIHLVHMAKNNRFITCTF
ncbi:glutamate racemase [Flammeovirga kamogawensis]|uniref:Glutamate racemase n=1 Tax=Flammeovirga kamogawensis TaxID=373891 RepID=A0ABX8GYS8_9BACT|nr:glutamate racemase [Flammeovirga kamogawensis]MBB6459164.1 glutamate racemase [Flammeovirga kamogawensis]QWG08730.1 glutamate racemase [Flammeovirga kamogawensis]TRX67023.1 glutamate racemase [Flammeovirga kamogawensis]